MILVDYRAGSQELILPLQRLGLPVEEADLPTGDLLFEGRGIGGAPLSVGIEYKKVGELVQSVRTNRVNEQLRKMREEGAYDHSWLLVEGELLYDDMGRLVRRKGRRSFAPLGMTHAELLKRVLVLELCGGLHPWWTQTRRDSCKFIEFLYRTYTDTDLDKHKSHLGLYEPALQAKPTQFQRTVQTWPGVGSKVAKAARKPFKSVRRAANATAAEWAALETRDNNGKARKVGLVVGQRIVDAVTKEE